MSEKSFSTVCSPDDEHLRLQAVVGQQGGSVVNACLHQRVVGRVVVAIPIVDDHFAPVWVPSNDGTQVVVYRKAAFLQK
jgi:hypothetical protein